MRGSTVCIFTTLSHVCEVALFVCAQYPLMQRMWWLQMNNLGIRLPLPEYNNWKENEQLLFEKQKAGRILAANVWRHASMFGRSENVCV